MIARNRCVLCALLLCASATYADGLDVGTSALAPPIEVLYGAYEVIGKSPGADGKNYRAWVRIAVEEQHLILDRCFDGKRSEGYGRLISVGADRMSAVQFEFSHQTKDFQATCLYQSDFDNLPRFSCYTYPRSEPNIEVPGLEAYFPIVWPVALDYFDCQ